MLFFRDFVATCTIHSYWLTGYSFINTSWHMKICSESTVVGGFFMFFCHSEKNCFLTFYRSSKRHMKNEALGSQEVGERVRPLGMPGFFLEPTFNRDVRKGSLWVDFTIALHCQNQRQNNAWWSRSWFEANARSCLQHINISTYINFNCLLSFFFLHVRLSLGSSDKVLWFMVAWISSIQSCNTCAGHGLNSEIGDLNLHESRRTYLWKVWDDTSSGVLSSVQTFTPHFKFWRTSTQDAMAGPATFSDHLRYMKPPRWSGVLQPRRTDSCHKENLVVLLYTPLYSTEPKCMILGAGLHGKLLQGQKARCWVPNLRNMRRTVV